MLRHTLITTTAALSLGARVVLAASLPDTGQDTCCNNVASDMASAEDTGTHPRQDCRYGRDAAAKAGQLTKLGGGDRGFDYSKIANNGTNLGAAPAAMLGTAPGDWACTLDNVTGLTWEVKTAGAASAELRSMNSTYTWYSSNAATNGGNAGTPAAIVGIPTCQTLGRCDTEKFVADVNAAALCGYTDWRMPTVRELETLVHVGAANPAIHIPYFPNTPESYSWSGSVYVSSLVGAWSVYFGNGKVSVDAKFFALPVRLVRGGQF